jgi:hypothetical protein
MECKVQAVCVDWPPRHDSAVAQLFYQSRQAFSSVSIWPDTEKQSISGWLSNIPPNEGCCDGCTMVITFFSKALARLSGRSSGPLWVWTTSRANRPRGGSRSFSPSARSCTSPQPGPHAVDASEEAALPPERHSTQRILGDVVVDI